MENKKIKILAFCSKSGCGKSTVINELAKLNDIFYIIKSNTSRLCRDEFDKETHIFLDEDTFFHQKMENEVIAEYKSPLGYYNWVSLDNFEKNKINLYAIDIKACIKLLEDNRFDISIIYLHCDEKERIERLRNRGEKETVKYVYEPHLELDFTSYCKHKDRITIINAEKGVNSVIKDILNLSGIYLTTFEFYTFSNKYVLTLLDKTLILEDCNNHEKNEQEILDFILGKGNYKYIGFSQIEDWEELYIEYNKKLFTFYQVDKEKGFCHYKIFIETLLKWVCGVNYDRIN